MADDPGTGRHVFSAAARRALLDSYGEALATLRSVSDRLDEDEENEGLWAAFAAAQQRLAAARDGYVDGLPAVPLARCPFSGELLLHSFDPFGLDGLWWNAEGPARPGEETLPATMFALTGAVSLAEPVEHFPFLCKPGPEAPFVVPRILAVPEIRAVVSSLPVGRHTAFPVVYFASAGAPPIERFNTWGTNDYRFRDAAGNEAWDEAPEDPEDYSFDLEPWLANGKLVWVAPGDTSLALRQGIDGCPYLGRSGRREPLRIQAGTVWGPSSPGSGER